MILMINANYKFSNIDLINIYNKQNKHRVIVIFIILFVVGLIKRS